MFIIILVYSDTQIAYFHINLGGFIFKKRPMTILNFSKLLHLNYTNGCDWLQKEHKLKELAKFKCGA